jgi:hypothetical protein
MDPAALLMVLGVLTGWLDRREREASLVRIMPIGDRHFRRAIGEYGAHYHDERNYQALDKRLIALFESQPKNTKAPTPTQVRSECRNFVMSRGLDRRTKKIDKVRPDGNLSALGSGL